MHPLTAARPLARAAAALACVLAVVSGLADSEIGACHVYRLDPATGALQVIADDFERPNGLACSADERQLYISDS